MASLQNEHSFFIIGDTIAGSPVAAHNWYRRRSDSRIWLADEL